MSIENSIIFNFHHPDPPELDGKCPRCRVGVLFLCRAGDCACHIHAPCSACTNASLKCPECHEEFDR